MVEREKAGTGASAITASNNTRPSASAATICSRPVGAGRFCQSLASASSGGKTLKNSGMVVAELALEYRRKFGRRHRRHIAQAEIFFHVLSVAHSGERHRHAWGGAGKLERALRVGKLGRKFRAQLCREPSEHAPLQHGRGRDDCHVV